jgi:peptidoglycan/xylan/chitin deacetylase (PgdA/CDA1 family)
VALSALSAAYGLNGRVRDGLARPRVQVLYLHFVFEDQLDSFDALVGTLARYSQFVSYSEALDHIASGESDAPCVTFTFDDGLANCRDAADILERHGARAAFFVCPGIVGEANADNVAAFCRRRLNMPPTEFMSWDDIEDLARRGHEIGNHTMDHADLGAVSTQEAADQIESASDALRRKLGGVQHFAWPYGQWSNFTPDAEVAAARAGLTCAAAVRGCHHPSSTPRGRVCVRRDHVVASWPMAHTLYFLARNALRPLARDDGWRDDWPEWQE